MSSCCRLFVVDDDATTALIIESMLGGEYGVEAFESAADCLARLPDERPDLFLLDVQMPGMDGYELCRRIKSDAATREIPVIFLSGRDTLEDILAGYDAGAQDYIVKPFQHTGLQRKLENLLRIERDRRALQAQVAATDELVTVFSRSLDDNAVLIKYLRTLSEQDSVAGLVEATLQVLGAYQLAGAIQIRMRDAEKTYSQAGEDWPMEIAVIQHLRNQGRIFEFRSRSIYNFEYISILVTNMPQHDPDACGRIRDNLAIIAESADAKLMALQALQDRMHLHDQIAGLLDGLSRTVEQYGRRYDEARFRGSLHTTRLIDKLLASMAHLAISSEQEDAILDLVRVQSEDLIDLFDFAQETRTDLTELKSRLESMLAMTTSQAGPAPRPSVLKPEVLF